MNLVLFLAKTVIVSDDLYGVLDLITVFFLFDMNF